jgi:lysophospholipase L1-like esterase
MQKLATTMILLCVTSIAVEASEWTGTWSTSVYSDSQLNTTFDNMTLRQVVRVSIPGNQVRLTFSNLYGSTPLVMQKVHLAQSAGGHSIVTGTDLTVTFGGSESVTIPAGGTVTSDSFGYNLPALTKMAITIYFGDVPSTVSGHVGSRTTSYWQSGDAVAASSLTSPSSDTHWYVIDRMDVHREDAARAVSCYGDSITDGYGTTTDAQNRWTDFLATRLQGVTETSDVGVLNAGIGATSVSTSGLSRLQRDVLDQTDVRYLIVVYGVNDIGGSTSVSNILSAYQSIITNAHNNGILVYGGTIMPFGGSGHYSTTNESERQQVNNWIRTTNAAAGGFDVVIDFDAALRDPSDHTRLLPVYSNDGLHPSVAGYEAMADAIPLALFSLDETPPAVPVNLTTSAQSYKQIDLDWDDNSEDDFSHYNVWRSTSSGGPYTEAATVTSSAYSDVDPADRLSPSTTYYYVVTAVDNSGNESANSTQGQATTDPLPTDTDAPTPNPAAWDSAPAATGATVITMTADTGDDLYGPVEYYFTCTAGGGHDSDWQISPTYTDSGLSANTQYTYTVKMRDDLGNIGDYSTPGSATTFEGPGEFQEAGGIVSMESENGTIGGNGWVVSSNASASNGAFIQNTVNYTGQSAPECTSPDCIASYDFNISTGGNYRFWFRTYSNSYDDDSLFWRIDNGTWIFENGRSGIGSWHSTDHTQVDTLSAGSHTLEIGYREDGTILDKFVIQLDSLATPTGDGPAESSQNQGSNDQPPSAPSSLNASVSGNQVDLTWSAVTNASGYKVKRAETSGGPYTVIEPNTPATSYSDSTVVKGVTYYYVVSAVNAYGESPNSNEVSRTPGIAELETFKLDFDGKMWGNQGPTEEGYESYQCEHEVPASFGPRSYSAFNTTITIEPTWAAGAPNTAMQAINRGAQDGFPYEYTAEVGLDLVSEWIGTDTRETPGDPLTMTISSLPSGRYTWLSYHNDLDNQPGVFEVTVNDAAGSATTSGFDQTDTATNFDEVGTCELEIMSNGVDPVSLDFHLTSGTFFAMNGFEIRSQYVPDYDGDLDRDGKVDMVDMAELGKDWQSIYNMDTLTDIANDWLLGTGL